MVERDSVEQEKTTTTNKKKKKSQNSIGQEMQKMQNMACDFEGATFERTDKQNASGCSTPGF